MIEATARVSELLREILTCGVNRIFRLFFNVISGFLNAGYKDDSSARTTNKEMEEGIPLKVAASECSGVSLTIRLAKRWRLIWPFPILWCALRASSFSLLLRGTSTYLNMPEVDTRFLVPAFGTRCLLAML